ncbi:MAG: putative addiction module antidote protein [Deltaproteobacteria bacterium]|nr:putative addiction module antidote protein [Deltaproteobacteria bacterium]
MKNTDYQEDLIEWLKNPKHAAGYLNEAIEEGEKELILLALRNVAEAQGGMSNIAEKASLNRENLYRMLSKRGNPQMESIIKLLHALGLKLTIEPELKAA